MRKVVFLLIMIGVIMADSFNAADLEVTVKPESGSVKLGEDVILNVSVKNTGEKKVTVKELVIGKGAVELKIDMGGGAKKWVYTRVLGGVYQPDGPDYVALASGESTEGKITVPAMMPGKMDIVVSLYDKIDADAVSVNIEGKGSVGITFDTDEGKMVARMLPDLAPNTTANIVALARSGYYDGLKFHRIVKGFMIQGGCPDGNGMGGPGFSIPAEFNNRPHVKGILSMARSQHPDSAGSQFFVVHGDANFLDGQYTVYGELTEGEDVLEKLANLPVGPSAGGEMSAPQKAPVMKKVTVCTVK